MHLRIRDMTIRLVLERRWREALERQPGTLAPPMAPGRRRERTPRPWGRWMLVAATLALVAFSRFIGVLVLFPITGSPMNFLVLLSLNILLPGSNYYAALTFFAGEMLGIAISFALSLLTIWATDWFHPKTGDGIFGLKTPKSLETETKA